MATTTSSPGVEQPGHRRNKSTSVLRSIIAPKSHRRTPSDGEALRDQASHHPIIPTATPMLPPDHPHSHQQRPAGRQKHGDPPSPRKPNEPRETPLRTLHKKTKSSVSLRSLAKDKDKSKHKPARDAGRTGRDKEKPESPMKKKSSSTLAAMFQKQKSPKDGRAAPSDATDKENTTPPGSATAESQIHTPIWAQFSSHQPSEVTTTTKVPLNDRRSIEQEIALYTPTEYSPSKQRNFFDYGQPSLQRRSQKERPKSSVLPSTSTSSFLDTLSRKISNDRTPLGATKGNEDRRKESRSPSKGSAILSSLGRKSMDEQRSKDSQPKQEPALYRKGARVMAAVAAFNNKAKGIDGNSTPAGAAKLNPDVVDAEFEAVLESRNIPQHQRAQMRTLKLEVKADFVRTHKLDTPQSVSRATSAQSSIATKGKRSVSSKSGDQAREASEKVAPGSDDAATAAKRTRPRSRTFTFGKADAPSKKQKADGVETKPSKTVTKSPSSRSLASIGSQKSSIFSKKTSLSSPADFVAYLRTVRVPQDVEVGKLHKLRLLLRNETVEWVDIFIKEGGMSELVSLLHRIMEVEWREEHEDTLLHETLRALKGLCTTDAALRELCGFAPTLFPALLAMIFDEEHKGPSEFTTRELVVNLLFIHLSSASEGDLPSRARALLGYLKDPVKEKESSTIPFILQMHQSRPYQVWCKEMTNVTKEVFWIFIHHLNVIPLPASTSEAEPAPYWKAHFPGPRAIVPAAPYVGGVEWDATNYIASHLDLLNGLIASLPTQAERNELRTEFKVSGLEKLMGHLRTCNPKYYGAVHDAAKVWIGAALEDGWEVKTVRMGEAKAPGSPVKSPKKGPKKAEKAPKIEAPKMDLGLGLDLDVKLDAKLAKKDDDWF